MVNISNASPEQINSSLYQTQATFARRRREKMQIFRLKIHPLWVDWTFVGWAARSGIRSPAYVPTPTWSALPIFTLHTAFVPTWNGRYTTIISVLLIEKFQRTEPRTASTVNRRRMSCVCFPISKSLPPTYWWCLYLHFSRILAVNSSDIKIPTNFPADGAKTCNKVVAHVWHHHSGTHYW